MNTPSAAPEVTLLDQLTKHPKCLNFSDPTQREAHIQVFLAWLPTMLHDAPEIDWKQLPSPVMGYLIRNLAPDDPDVVPITLALGSAMHALKQRTLLAYCYHLAVLLRRVRTQYGMSTLMQLRTRQFWDHFMKERTLSSGELKLLLTYEALASVHVRAYLDGLDVRHRAMWEPYALPPLPVGFTYKQHGAVMKASEQRRKDQSEVLLPLFPLLVELAQLRKQASERLTKEFRKQRDRALAGEIELPYHFQYTDRFFSVTEDAATLAEAKLIEQEVALSLTLWDRTSWVREHLGRYGRSTRKQWKRRGGPYAPENNTYFLQYDGLPGNLLWFGALIADHRLGFASQDWSLAFRVTRPGLLTPMKGASVWLHYARRHGDVLFEPESLYRGTLFATALATLALTNGSRVSELLQVSATRFETLVVDELKDQQLTGRKIGILVQKLLPKGSRHESERQFFLIGDMAARLLTEIGQLLEATHGGTIPVVHPSTNTKAEDLHPEPYLFQWDTSTDGRVGLLTTADVGHLLRFLFYGLTLTTRTGTPIRVATHLLRHVLATHARHVQNIPAEAVAFLLHHRVVLEGRARALTISEATAYYSRMPMHQLLALLFEAQSKLISYRNRSYLQVPPPRTLEQMDAALRRIFEQWGLIGPTALGYCSAGLCVRPDNRALCLNCPHLVPHYSNMPKAKIWRRLYVLQARMHDAHGHSVDAQQARQMIGYLDDIIRVMEIQIRTRQDGGYLSFADTLPSAQDDEGDV